MPSARAILNPKAVISEIIGVAGAGFRTSLILNAVSCEVEGEGLEVHNISKTVTLFSLALKNVGISLQSLDSVHSTEALEGINKISEDAMDIFDQFNDMLDKVRAKPAEGTPQYTVQQRFQWAFKRHRVQYMLAQLDSFKMDVSLFQGILSLGKLMASTSRHDSPDEVELKKELIRQERAEAQNVLIVRYWQRSKMDKLWEASCLEDDDHKIAAIEAKEGNDLALVSSNQVQQTDGPQRLAIETAPPGYESSLALVKLPAYSLGDLDDKLSDIKKSSKDMVQVSSDVIDPLLERWTRWYDIREKRHAKEAKNRYVPTVDNLQEDDDNDDGMHPYRRYNSRTQEYEPNDQQRKGPLYLEGNTTDWRQPQSAAAQREYSRRKNEYRRYQPSISQDNSDDGDTLSNGSRGQKKAPRRHIIDSASESDDSDHDPHPPQGYPRTRPRKGSNSPTQERSFPALYPGQHNPHASPRPPPGAPVQGGQRPYPQHAYSAPGLSPYPPINVANAHNPYAPSPHSQPGHPLQHYNTGPASSSAQPQSSYPGLSTAHARYTPAGAVQPQPQPQNGSANANRNIQIPYQDSSRRPVSRDGSTSARSSYSSKYPPPERQQSQPGSLPAPKLDRDGRQVHYDPTGRPFVFDQQGNRVLANLLGTHARPERQGKGAKGKLAEGATKGLLGAGAIAGFLEALEGLSI
ncbi:uncharacterized protein AB675_3705 [Cyphellophora attinorum]|uniref:Uncharacterized protein n=1 Tax=Cyphellophora attinorum TaxID=1664694 RepID=A0A0N1H033_9EURO|nr:uncharacterized protein AB675_3705 [Phialophora attinorum]KPI37064.1 hypothetical protein AB675_3705 [Phialophora attinorum]